MDGMEWGDVFRLECQNEFKAVAVGFFLMEMNGWMDGGTLKWN